MNLKGWLLRREVVMVKDEIARNRSVITARNHGIHVRLVGRSMVSLLIGRKNKQETTGIPKLMLLIQRSLLQECNHSRRNS